MANQSSITPASTGILPVSRLVPVLQIDKIGQTGQELASKISQLVIGQTYSAEVKAKISDHAYQVKVDGLLLKMDLGNAAQAGKTLQLRFMQHEPVPTFFLSSTQDGAKNGSAQLSNTGQLITNLLQEAKMEGASNRFQSHTVITQHPNNAQLIAQDLKQAVSQTGLFYESHLEEFVKGHRSLESIVQESQHLNQQSIANLVSQQLHVLETQRFSWGGEVWAGQKMQLDIFQSSDDVLEKEAKSHTAQALEGRPIYSEVTLHLPILGKVTAKLSLADGRLKVNLLADKSSTLNVLNHQRPVLAAAIEKNGQQLDALTVTPIVQNNG